MSYWRGGTWRQKWERLKVMGGQGSHNKPIGCGASGAYALGPDDKEEEDPPQLNYDHQPAAQDLKPPVSRSQTVMPDLKASCQLCSIVGSKFLVLHRWAWAGITRIETAKWCDAVSVYIAGTITWRWAYGQVTLPRIRGAVVPGTCTTSTHSVTCNMYLTGQMVRLMTEVVTQNDRCFMQIILLQ